MCVCVCVCGNGLQKRKDVLFTFPVIVMSVSDILIYALSVQTRT